jgi:NADPH2:quinone reductase
MKAVFAISPGKLEIREVPIPVPELGEVLIKVDCFPIHTLDCSYFNSRLELE